MAIEKSIQNLADAMNNLAAAITAHNELQVSHTKWLSDDNYADAEKSAPTAEKAETISAPAPAPAPAPVAEPQPEPASTPANPSLADLRQALTDIASLGKKYRDLARDLVAEYSTDRTASGVPDDKRQPLIDALRSKKEQAA